MAVGGLLTQTLCDYCSTAVISPAIMGMAASWGGCNNNRACGPGLGRLGRGVLVTVAMRGGGGGGGGVRPLNLNVPCTCT